MGGFSFVEPLMDVQQQEQDAAAIWDQLDREDSGQATPPEPEPPRQEQRADPPAAETPPAQAGGDPPQETATDLPADMPQDVKDRIAGLESLVTQMQSRLRNAEGNIGGLKSQMGTQLQAAQSVRNAGGDAPSATEIREAQGDPEAAKRLREDYPEFASAIDSFMEAKLTSFRQQANPSNGLTREDLEAELKHLKVEIRHPGWESMVKEAEFAGWYQRQPREVKLLGESSEVADAIRLLDLFSDARKAARERSKANQQPSPNVQAAAAIPSGRSNGAKPVSMDEMTPAQLWAYFDAQEGVAPRR